MDEETGVRMTRLRRRLSVEQNEDVSSPATPTKKRGSKLPKPALENIAENVTVDSPKRTTRRSMAMEAVGEDLGTPNKKGSRKVNTSLLSESINTESPRAIRVTRRSSFAGSEAETSAVPTPIRRSRRISKEYNKSPENLAEISNLTKKTKKGNTTIEEIQEENVEEAGKSFPSTTTSKETNDFLQVSGESGHSEKSSPSNIRKSPRLSVKKNMSTVEEECIENKERINLKQDTPKNKKVVSESIESPCINVSKNQNRNKKRSKSFTILEKENNDSRIYFSDNEIRKAKSKNKSKVLPAMIEIKQIGDFKNMSPRKSVSLQFIQNKSFSKDDSIFGAKVSLADTTKHKVCNDSVHSKEINFDKNDENKNFDKSGKNISSTIIMDDCQDNNLIEYSVLKKDNSRVLDNSCEPMDVDVSIPEINISTTKDGKSLQNQDKTINSSQNNTIKKIKNVSTEKNMIHSTFLENTDSDSIMLNANKSHSDNNTDKNKPQDKEFGGNKSNDPMKDEQNLMEGATDNTPIMQKILKKVGVITSTPIQNNIASNDFVSHEKLVNNKLTKQDKIIKPQQGRDSSDSEVEKNEFVDNEAVDAGDDYESGDSQNESEREFAEENDIPTKGETLNSDEDESDDTEYEKDSFVVSSDEEDNELLSGSGDDLSMSDNELKITKQSKEKYNEKKTKEQKRASREMFEARHGKDKSSFQDDDTDDPDITFVSKNKKRNRLRLDSSKEASELFDHMESSAVDNNIMRNKSYLVSSKDTSVGKLCDEPEITILANTSEMCADPLLSFSSIKKELLDVSTINEVGVKEIENVNVDQDVTIFSHKDSKNPLESFKDDESSESDSSDGGIANNYDSLLNELNNSKEQSGQKQFILEQNAPMIANKFKGNLSHSENKISKNKNDSSLIGKLNLTLPEKEKKINQISRMQLSSLENGNIDSKRKISNCENKLVETSTSTLRCGKNRKQTNGISTTITDEIPVKKNIPLAERKTKKPKDSTSIQKSHTKNADNQFSGNDSSSDAIDLKLLFTPDEDSNDALQNNKLEEDDTFIPLKRSEAKTNLLEESQCFGNEAVHLVEQDQVKRKSRKRKRRNDAQANNKINLSSPENKTKVTRLPQSIIEKLDDRPQNAPKQKPTIVATSRFDVETVIPRKNKPSQYLEESVYLDQTPVKLIKDSKKMEKPQVLPSLPKAIISNAGFTSNFKVNILKQEKRHDALLAGPELKIQNFKTHRLYGPNIKRIATEELCRKQKKIKINKF